MNLALIYGLIYHKFKVTFITKKRIILIFFSPCMDEQSGILNYLSDTDKIPPQKTRWESPLTSAELQYQGYVRKRIRIAWHLCDIRSEGGKSRRRFYLFAFNHIFRFPTCVDLESGRGRGKWGKIELKRNSKFHQSSAKAPVIHSNVSHSLQLRTEIASQRFTQPKNRFTLRSNVACTYAPLLWYLPRAFPPIFHRCRCHHPSVRTRSRPLNKRSAVCCEKKQVW